MITRAATYIGFIVLVGLAIELWVAIGEALLTVANR